SSKRNVVAAAETVGRSRGTAVIRRRAAAASSTAALVAHVGAATAAAPPPPAREDEVGRVHLGLVALLAFFVVVARRAKAALDEDGRTLGEKLGERFAALSPEDHVVPVGALLPNLVAVEIGLGGGDPHVEHRLPGLGVAKLGVGAEIPEQHHTIQS